MIGQKELQKTFKAMEQDKFPPLIILVGSEGCGKTTAARYIATAARSKAFYISGNKAEEVRETVEQAYSQVANVFYFFKNAQEMTAQAQNALLKLTEEPPHKAKIIISVDDKSKVLGTLLSRAFVYQFMPYSHDELRQFAVVEGIKYHKGILYYVSTPGELRLSNTFDFTEMLGGIREFLKNLRLIKGLNLVKKLKLKEEDEGYDKLIFLRALEIESAKDNNLSSAQKYRVLCKISQVRQALNYTGVNKKMLFEDLMLHLVEVLE